MYEEYRSRSRDGDGSHHRRSSPQRHDDRSEQHHLSTRKDSSRSPPRSPEEYARNRRPYDNGNGYDGDGDVSRGMSSRDRPYGSRQHNHYQDRDGGEHEYRRDIVGRRSPYHEGRGDALMYDDTSLRSDGPGSPGHGLGPLDEAEESRRGGRPDDPRSRYPRLARDDRSPVREHRSGRRRSYSRSRSRSPARGAAPHHTLILESLPADATEQDILFGLDEVVKSTTFSSDCVKAIRVRSNRRGQRIVFVEFYRISDAAEFMDRYYPSITFTLVKSRGPDSELVSVGINFSRSREDSARSDAGREDGSWKCLECYGINYARRSTCYRCNMERLENGNAFGAGMGMAPMLTGETDEDPQQQPSQFLVVRDLEASVTEETLSKGLMKLFVENNAQAAKEPTQTPNKLKSTAPTASIQGLGARPGSLNRVFLMRDRLTNESWRYGFAEFTTIDDAQGAIAKYRASPKFTIASKPVIVAFIHTGVFVPALQAITSATAPFFFAPTYNSDIRLKYWDDRAYPSVLDVEPSVTGRSSPNPEKMEGRDKSLVSTHRTALLSQDAAAKKNKKDKDSAAAAKKAAGLAMAPQMQMWAKKRAELHAGSGQKPRDAGDVASLQHSAPTEDVHPGPRAPHSADEFISYGDYQKMQCLLCMRRFESERDLRDHEILDQAHAASLKDGGRVQDIVNKLAEQSQEPRTVIRRIPRDRTDAAPIYFSYADAENGHCLVCERKFKNLAVLRLHERESELHRKNMRDDKNIERAVAELAKLDRNPVRMRPALADHDKNQYRDRAKERRRVYSQPKKPAQQSSKDGRKRQQTENTTAAAPEKKEVVPSKGAALLGKMGWSTGQGLGAEGNEGRTEAIATDLYVPGVGLGADGGKVGDAAAEAARRTQSHYSDFVEKTKDKARERYDRLG